MKLKVDNLTYSISGITIVSDVSLKIQKGEFVGLLGPNGCGKSTLLKNIYHVLSPDAGSVYLDEDNIGGMGSKELARKMSVMIQENSVEFDMNVLDMVMLGRYAHKRMFGSMTKEDLDIARSALKEVGMEDYEERSFLSLSGGEKQRILIARVLAQKTDFIILDEPTNHLDIQYQFQIMDILKAQNVTVFSSVHDLNIAAFYCDKIIVMKKGKIIHYGTPEEILVPEIIDELYHIRSQVSENAWTGKRQIYYIPNSV